MASKCISATTSPRPRHQGQWPLQHGVVGCHQIALTSCSARTQRATPSCVKGERGAVLQLLAGSGLASILVLCSLSSYHHTQSRSRRPSKAPKEGTQRVQIHAIAPDMASSVHHPSALRNRGPILEQLQQILSADTSGYALEVACNTGAHMEVFAPAFPKLTWQPSDRDLSTAEAYSTLAGVLQGMPNVLEPLSLDLCQPVDSWPPEVLKQERSVRLFYASNVTHISPWEVTVGLLAGAGRLLQEDGDLVIYGPFKENGGFSTESNEAFDARLRAQDPEWGYRDVQDLEDEARKSGLFLKMRIDMPANNLLLHFKRKS